MWEGREEGKEVIGPMLVWLNHSCVRGQKKAISLYDSLAAEEAVVPGIGCVKVLYGETVCATCLDG
jgi:hypothetical protein